MTAEHQRLAVNANKAVPLAQWGPYLSERQWGTVGEDGLAGISDFFGNLCFCIALWNGHDPILKERLFGLGNPQGNHGEDVKECYFYLDATPTHSYLKALYKYPQREYP